MSAVMRLWRLRRPPTTTAGQLSVGRCGGDLDLFEDGSLSVAHDAPSPGRFTGPDQVPALVQ